MSSSSSATEPTVASMLEESFDILVRELPAAYERMCARLAGRSVAIRVDDERLVVAFEGGRAAVSRIEAADETWIPVIRTNRRAIADVIDARRTLADAVMADQVEAIAPLADLADIQRGLATYVHGAVRCPSFPDLLRRFLASCNEAGDLPSSAHR